MSLYITTLYALPLILIWFILWVRVAKSRAEHKVSIGDGGSKDLLLRIRHHGNFIEWVPFVLILMALAELQGAPHTWIYAAGALLVLGRVVHPFGLKADIPDDPLRYISNSSNWLAVAILGVALIRIVSGL
jgi:uncharacterized protein